ncbi:MULTISPECIES: GerAB/ArcD/ProY family transporter [Clostridium]|uniref:GerAB/ArcD/ProY family transporter n=1 Tax=Clostridium TaxID=1485 RepID=UPI0008268B50|nr:MULTISPECIES: GerAB/ArcD/ProY family transporter [Clostridium]PJI10431.1 spore gernimation protein [Clostridium sp. CT7]
METKISVRQLFAAIVLVPFGSAVLFFINPKAKQDAWIAILIYIIPAVILQLIYVSLWNKYPEDTPVTYMPKIFGKVIGYTLSIIYIVFFAYEAARVLRDFDELIAIASMQRLHLYITSIILMITVAYALFNGIETLSRMVYIFLYLWIFFVIFEWIFLYMTPGDIKFFNLQPILENGFMPIIKDSWKLITFPFGESIVLAMFFPLVKERAKVRKAAVWAIILEGVLLALNTIMFIAVLGVNFASVSLFPFLQTLRTMRVGSAFDRLDIFVILVMVIVGFLKIGFFTYGAALGTAQLAKLKDTKYISLVFCIIVTITSLIIARNYPQHIYIGQTITLTYIHLPLTVIIPTIALFVYGIKYFIQKIRSKS